MMNRISNVPKSHNLLIIILYLAVSILVLINISNSFFWDTIQLGSQHANYYNSTNFSSIFLPNDLDSGHIPAFGMYIALLWKIFGRTLEVSHLAILPFALGIVYQLIKICRRYISEKYLPAAIILIISDPTLLSQMTLVSPDVPLMFFFLMCLNAVLDNKKILLSIGVVFLFLISMRGMMIGLCLVLVDVYCNANNWKPKALFQFLVKRSILYFPALIVFVLFNYYHFQQTGWFGFHADSPWGKSFERVGVLGFIKNIGVLGWRLIDFGRIGIWIVFASLLIIYRKKIVTSTKSRQLLIIFCCFLIILPLNMLWAKGLLGHRYLLPVTICFSIWCAHILFSDFVSDKHKAVLASLWFVVLVSGNYWVYPMRISQGWDATLAHLPYYDLRQQAINYLRENDIQYENVGSFFPNTAAVNSIDLNGDPRRFVEFNRQDYIIYSNVFNVDDESLNRMLTEYLPLKKFENGNIFVTVYKKK